MSYSVELPTVNEAQDYLDTVAAFNLDYFSEQLVQEARQGIYDLRTRAVFLTAVGAQALGEYEQDSTGLDAPPYGIWAEAAIRRLHSLELIASYDDNMPYWQTDKEWGQGIRRAFRSIQPVAKSYKRPKFSAAGCTIQLEHYQQGRAYVRASGSLKAS